MANRNVATRLSTGSTGYILWEVSDAFVRDSSGLGDMRILSAEVYMERPRLMNKGLLRLDLQGENSGQPKYERLKSHLVEEMLNGRLRPGQALPSEHRLVKKLGVARMTVRRAMISLENDGLICRMQGKGNFVTKDAKRKLKRGLDIFAVVVPDTRGGLLPTLLHGFEDAARDVHHQTIMCNTDGDMTRQGDIMLQLVDKEVGGVALLPTNLAPTPAHHIRPLQAQGIPIVFLHRRVEGIRAPLLAFPYYEVGYLAGKTIIQHGHRRVAFFTAGRSAAGVSAYQEGLRQALRSGGSDLPDELSFYNELTRNEQSVSVWREQDVLAELQGMFALPDPPTAIFTTLDWPAEGIYYLLQQMGLRVPEDVSLVGLAGTRREGVFMQRLASVMIDEIATGQRAVSLLHEMRCGDRAIDDDEEFSLKLGFYDGKTLATLATPIQHN